MPQNNRALFAAKASGQRCTSAHFERPIGLSFFDRLDWLCQLTVYVGSVSFISKARNGLPSQEGSSYVSVQLQYHM